MLSQEERNAIESALEHVPVKESIAIDALRIVQEHRGWISDEAIDDLSAFLGLSAAELDSVSTFYNLLFRKPVGRHVIFICDSVSCWIMGYSEIRRYLESKLGILCGETTPDGRFTLLPIVCLGACDHAPAMMIDRDLHGDLDPARIDAILETYK